MKATLIDGTVLEGQVYELHAFLNLSVSPKKEKARQDKKPKPQENHRKVKRKCKSRPNAHARWSKFEDVKLIKLHKQGKSKRDIAKWLGRTYQSVHSRLGVLRKKGIELKG